MSFQIFLIGLFSLVMGGFLGIRRLSFLSLFVVCAFVTFIFFRAFHGVFCEAFVLFGFEYDTSYYFSLCIVIFLPLVVGLSLGVGLLSRLGLLSYSLEDPSFRVIDKVFGAGFSLLIFLIGLSIY